MKPSCKNITIGIHLTEERKEEDPVQVVVLLLRCLRQSMPNFSNV